MGCCVEARALFFLPLKNLCNQGMGQPVLGEALDHAGIRDSRRAACRCEMERDYRLSSAALEDLANDNSLKDTA